jgi:hypothetical protein
MGGPVSGFTEFLSGEDSYPATGNVSAALVLPLPVRPTVLTADLVTDSYVKFTSDAPAGQVAVMDRLLLG